MEITVIALVLGSKLVPLPPNASLEEYDPDRLKTWKFTSQPDNAGLSLKTLQKITAPQGSAAYGLDYVLAYAEVHCTGYELPDGTTNTKPTRTDFESFDRRILNTYVARADGTELLTKDEIESIKKPEPSVTES